MSCGVVFVVVVWLFAWSMLMSSLGGCFGGRCCVVVVVWSLLYGRRCYVVVVVCVGRSLLCGRYGVDVSGGRCCRIVRFVLRY